jgi:hypothetical protein|tara:strand:+ start:546 stop:923 length:378 start_codon:yes stop_codon:yes gene_type:complete
MTTKIKEEFKLTKHDVEVCNMFLIFADRQIDFLKEEIDKSYNDKDWSYLGGNAYDMDSLSNMKQLIDRLVNSPIDKDQTRSGTNIGKSLRDTFEESIASQFDELRSKCEEVLDEDEKVRSKKKLN